MTPTTDLDLAGRLGLPAPLFDAARRPDLAEAWGDRVRLVASLRGLGRDDAEMVRAVLSHGGNPVPVRGGPVPMPFVRGFHVVMATAPLTAGPEADEDAEPEFDAPRM